MGRRVGRHSVYDATDGTLPITSSPVYSTPIPVSATARIYAMASYPSYPQSSPCAVPIASSTTLRAIALANALSQSNTVVAIYTISGHGRRLRLEAQRWTETIHDGCADKKEQKRNKKD